MEPSEYITDLVLELIADGASLERIEKIEGMPSRGQFLRWRRKDATLSSRYEKALQDRVALSFDKLSDVAFDLLNPEIVTYKGQMDQIRTATDILLKLMGAAAGIVTGMGVDKKDIAHIKIEFVESTESPPPEAL